MYHKAYRADAEVDFLLVPMPRLEVETIADFKVLFEIGALTPDMSIKLSRMLLGEEPGSKRQRTQQSKNQDAPRQPREDVEEAWSARTRPAVAMGP